MAAREAFYSIIQFCPDFDRAEGVNVGVALFLIPDGAVEVRVVDTSDAVRKRFPQVGDDRRLASERIAFCNRLRSSTPRSLDDIHTFMALELGRIVLIPPRTHRVEEELAAAADRLFAELVQPIPDDAAEQVEEATCKEYLQVRREG